MLTGKPRDSNFPALGVLLAVLVCGWTVAVVALPASSSNTPHKRLATEFGLKWSKDILRPAEYERELKKDTIHDIFLVFDSEVNSEGEDAIALDLLERLGDSTSRREEVYRQLVEQARSTQSETIEQLQKHKIKFQSFWIDNSIYITSVSSTMLREILDSNANIKVDKFREIHLLPLHQATDEEYSSGSSVEWGVSKLNADKVWRQGNSGEGVVVASIDSGVRYTHEALTRNYRGRKGPNEYDHDYNFYDATAPSQNNKSIHPDIDGNGHGTHTMGTAVGAKSTGVGVAPGAQWITVKAFDTYGRSSVLILKEAAQWIMCPKPVAGGEEDCSKGADVVLNAWDDPQGSTPWFKRILKSWLKANIAPIFAAGNTDAFHCGTVLSPADEEDIIAVGATLKSNIEWGASARGPSPKGKVKPDVVGPGFAIRSANSASDRKYVRYTGTSMAAPHIAGVVALLKHARPRASYTSLYKALTGTAQRDMKKPIIGKSDCGNIPWGSWPNNIYGHGLPDAEKAIAALLTSNSE
eukprot:Nk52_evm54s1020 gene=Nk52_evmTU54s1020